ncbi:hypothetical protein KKF19_00795 [Patescibacteria group bacterium]|nr:hypothetical protein [Patescibacteria group bacterium]
MSKILKKSVSIFTSITTICFLSGIAMLAPIASVGAVSVVDGDLVRNPNAEGMAQLDIYIVKIVGDKSFKRLILSPHVFESYMHFDKNGNGDNWDDVMDVDQATMDSLTTTDLVREDGNDKVYRLYAADGADDGNKYWLNMTAAEFLAVFDADAIYTINGTDTAGYTAGADVANASTVFPPGAVASVGTLGVTLAADTPAAGIAVGGAARLAFTKVNLTATGGDVIVDSLVVQRVSLANDLSFSSIDIIDASTNLPLNNTSKTFNSLHEATFTDDFTIANGTTKSVILAGNMAAKATLASYAGEVPALALSGLTLKDSATLNASLPLTGNTMTINSTITIGTATISQGAYRNASSTTASPTPVGKEDYTFFSFQVAAGSDEKVEFSQVKVYQEGSASLGSDLVDFELLQDGTKIADGVVASSKYVNFSFGTITLDKGQTNQFQVKATVADGSARTVKLAIYRNTDLLVKGLTYGYNITPTYSGTGSSATNPRLSDNEFVIGNGTLQVTKSNDVSSGNIAVGNNQYLGAYKFTVTGEPVTISAVTLTITSSGALTHIKDALSGLELVDPSGNAVAGPTDITNNAVTVAWTDTFTVPVGDTVYKVRGDLSTSGGWASDDTIYVSITPSGFTATGDVTGNSITGTPSSAVNGNTQTVKAASLTVTRNALPAAATIIAGQNNVVLSSWTFDATSSGEDIRVTSILMAGRGQAATNTGSLTIFKDVDGDAVWDDGSDVAYSPINSAIASALATSTFAFSDAIIIAAGTSVNIALMGNKTSVASNATENWGLTDNGGASIIAYGVTTGNTVTETLTEDDGPTMTSAASGTLTINLDSGTPSSKIVTAGETVEVARIKLTASNENIDVTQLVLNLQDGGTANGTVAGDSDDVTMFYLYKAGESTAFASGNISTGQTTRTWSFSKGILQVPKDSTAGLVIYVKAKLAGIGTGQTGASGADIKVGLGGTDGIKGYGAASGSEASETYTQSTSSAMTLHLAQPKVSLNTLSATALQSSAVMFDFNIANDTTEAIAVSQLNFWTATSGGGDINVNGAYLQAKLSGETSYSTVSAGNDGTMVNDNSTWAESFHYDLHGKNTATQTFMPYVVPAGDTARFQLMVGTITGLDATTGESISTYLCGDTATTTAEAAVVLNNSNSYSEDNQGNFVWSDLWSNNSTHYGANSNATTTVAQWWNGYLIEGLQTTSSPQTLYE